MKTALQLYSVREAIAADFNGTVAQVAAMGYAGVELAGCGNLTAREASETLRGLGLPVCGMHVLFDRLRGRTAEVAEEAYLLGTCTVVCPWFPPALLQRPGAFEWLGEQLDDIGAQFRALGLELLYHHHDFELSAQGSATGLSLLLGACQPRNVGCEIDVYFLNEVGGVDLIRRVFREQGARTRIVHLKDGLELGSGPVPFPEVFRCLDELPALEWQVVEQERYRHAPLEGARLGLAALREWGRA